MRTSMALLAALLTGCAGSRTPTPVSATTADITADDLRHRLFILAHDSMQGRETGSAGDYQAQEYIASEFRRLGLEPAGENGTYFQTVPFWRVAIDPQSTLSVDANALKVFVDFIPTSSGAAPLQLGSTAAIYGGSLADTAALLKPSDVAGQVVVVDVPSGTTRMVGLVAARYREAALRIRVQLDVVAPELMARLRDGRPVPDTGRFPGALQSVMVTRAVAARIFDADLGTLVPGAKGKSISGRLDYARMPTTRPARNVVAILRGRDPALAGQYLSLTAHNDHVGFDRSPVDHDSLRAFNRVVRPMGADSPQREATADEWVRIHAILDSLRGVNPPRQDSIRNGADDDGSGTVAILEIAEKLARGTRPRRSVLFVSHTGEEDGLVGSRWYTDHATVPTDSIVAEIDQDMIGRGLPSDLPGGFERPAATPTYLEVIGAKRLSREFGDTLEAANARQPVPFTFDYTYDAPGHPLQYYCRADHYSYARYGIPAVAFSRGEHLDYHQITDEPQYIDYPDLARVANMVYTAALAITNMPNRPKLDAPKPPLNQPCRQ
ncbi:MAG TPA: M28 family peptidase [Gemmatimonadales bacterium]|nr:M28 family peptidase [Gemmatimonadales bacterium]